MAMKRTATGRALLLASVSPAALMVGGGAQAADLALKAPAMAVPAYSWTGCYVGAHLGLGWGRQDMTETGTNTISNGSFTAPSTLTETGSSGLDSSGGLFGGQIGCNYQFASNWVVGLQGSAAYSNINGNADDPLGDAYSISMKTPWLASVTGRLGVTAWDNRALFYVTGGAAWDGNRWDLHNAFGSFSPATFSETRTGWVAGGGIEWALNPVWSVFAEYDYYQFDNGTTIAESSGNVFSTGKQEIDAFKVGVNYKLGQP
jgi:outer membrane immunogenic protein